MALSLTKGEAKVEEEIAGGATADDDEDVNEFIVFEFRDEARIVLETAECMLSAETILTQHQIPSAVSANVHNEAVKLYAEQQKQRLQAESQSNPANTASGTADAVDKNSDAQQSQ